MKQLRRLLLVMRLWTGTKALDFKLPPSPLSFIQSDQSATEGERNGEGDDAADNQATLHSTDLWVSDEVVCEWRWIKGYTYPGSNPICGVHCFRLRLFPTLFTQFRAGILADLQSLDLGIQKILRVCRATQCCRITRNWPKKLSCLVFGSQADGSQDVGDMKAQSKSPNFHSIVLCALFWVEVVFLSCILVYLAGKHIKADEHDEL